MKPVTMEVEPFCVCGHSIEEHGHDDAHPGSTACTECEDGECIAYEADPPSEEEEP